MRGSGHPPRRLSSISKLGFTPMTSTLPVPSRDAPVEFRSSGGLRLRLWFACLGGSLMAAGGIWWVIGNQPAAEPTPDLVLLVSWLGAVAGFGVISGAAFALWLDHGIVAHARGLAQAVAVRQIARLRGLPATSGWGELSLLTQQIQQLLVHYRHAERAAEDYGQVRDQLTILHQALERWNETERWPGAKIATGVVSPLADSIDRGLRRLDELRDQNLDAAHQVALELEQSLGEARQSSEQAERGFVDATALLTTIRELHRLHGELVRSLGVEEAAPAPRHTGTEPVARVVGEAIEDLVTGSTLSVERLAQGLRRMDGIVTQVALLANRATLVALDTGSGGRMLDPADQAEQARRLVAEIRQAVDDTARLSREMEDEVAGASSEVKAMRERAVRRLENLPKLSVAARSTEEIGRVLERVREMIQDATTKGERLSAAGERSSRAAEALLRRLETETREMEGLLARLAPVEIKPLESPSRVTPTPAGPTGLRLLGREDLLMEPGWPWREPDSGEQPR